MCLSPMVGQLSGVVVRSTIAGACAGFAALCFGSLIRGLVRIYIAALPRVFVRFLQCLDPRERIEKF